MKLAFIFVALLAAGAGGLVVWLVLRQDSGSGPTAAPTPAPTAPPTPMPTYGKFSGQTQKKRYCDKWPIHRKLTVLLLLLRLRI